MSERIVADPEVMMGKPVVRGTRITVESIVERLGAGESVEAIVGSHPRLTRQDVLAAIALAAEALKSVFKPESSASRTTRPDAPPGGKIQ